MSVAPLGRPEHAAAHRQTLSRGSRCYCAAVLGKLVHLEGTTHPPQSRTPRVICTAHTSKQDTHQPKAHIPPPTGRPLARCTRSPRPTPRSPLSPRGGGGQRRTSGGSSPRNARELLHAETAHLLIHDTTKHTTSHNNITRYHIIIREVFIPHAKHIAS